ncbi:MAG TPA: tetratricopeptide repeat protein, partial [Prolixibacteraceae bacterium]
MKFRLFILPVLFFILLTSFAQENTKRGLLYLDDYQYHKARNFFLDLIKSTPGDARIYCLLGDAYLGLQLPDSAKLMYDKAMKLDSQNPLPLVGIGKVALLKGDRMGKLESFEKARKIDKKNVEVYNEIAKGCIGLSIVDTTTGGLYLKQGFELNPKYAGLHITFGDYELMENRIGNAVNAYQRAIFFDPASAVAYRKLGVLQTKSRSFREAINTFNKCIQLNSSQILVYKNLGDLYYLLGKYPEAEKNYQVYMERAEISSDDKERYAFILFFNKKYTEAAKLLEDVLAQNSDESVLLRIRAYIACETGDYQKGLEYMEKFFKLHDPAKNIASDYSYYGRLLQMSGKYSLAIDNYKKALALDSTMTDIYDDLAKIYSTNKMHIEAVATYKKMLAYGADSVNTFFQIGKEYYFEGDNYRAKHDSLMTLQKAGKIPFADSTVVNESKRLYFQKADSAFTKVTILNPRYGGGFI